ncbi:MAG: hypothetical protein ACRC68_08405 [Clostridium sp.]
MYVAFGNKIVDSTEIKDKIEANTEMKIIKDMSKGSKRDDIIAYNISIDLDILNAEIKDTCNLDDLSEDELFEEYVAIAEEVAIEIEEYLPEEAIIEIRTYKWEPSDNDVKMVVAIAHDELGEVKLRDIIKRLLTQVN